MSGDEATTDRPPEQVAIGLIQDAESYRQAALLVEPRSSLESDVKLLTPAWFLLCHSAELALKAFLLSHGVAAGSRQGGLKHPSLRHNLNGLLAEAVRLGFKPPDEEFGDLMDWLSPYHEAHAFRYRQTGGSRLPMPFLIAEILEPVIADTAQIVRQQWMKTRGGS